MKKPLYRLQFVLFEVQAEKTEGGDLANPAFILFPPLTVPPTPKGYIEKKVMIEGSHVSAEAVFQIERRK